MIDQLRKTATTVYRSDSSSYYLDENRNPVYAETQVPILCSIQPYQDGNNTFRVPEGFNSIYGIVVFTETKIITKDELNDTVADEIEFEGNRFVCVDYAPWTGYGLLSIPDFYKCLFYRRDKLGSI